MRLLALLAAPLLAALVSTGCSAAPARSTAALPAEATPLPAGQPDLRCRSDADCTVKNVGNCCGAFPACVNVDSPVDPAAVQAQCRASGRMSVCGFREISACQCVQGQCAAKDAAPDTLRRPLPATEPLR